MKFTMEHVIKIYNDESGEHVYVGPDADGLDLVEIRSVDALGKIVDRLCIHKEEALMIARAIDLLYGDK